MASDFSDEMADQQNAGSVSAEVANWLAREFRAAAQQASTEEDLRIAGEAKLRQALIRLGIDSQPRYERIYANHAGRSDAVYGRVVIEYEAVGALSTAGGVEHAREQLERYLRAEVESSTNFDALKRVVGVGIDGHRIFFLRFRGADTGSHEDIYVAPGQGILPLDDDPALSGQLTPVVDGPYLVTGESIQTFLLYLRAASRSRLTPEGLAKQFGPDGPCAKYVVGTLAQLYLDHRDHPKISTLYGEWDRVFGIVYGVDLSSAGKHISILREAYGLSDELTLKPVLFAVHTYYSLLMKLLAAELLSMQRESLIESHLHGLSSSSPERLHRAIKRIETGELFQQFAVQNFLEADFFGWYLSAWEPKLSEAIRQMIRLLSAFEPATGVLDPMPTQDLLKRLYQYLIPREIRHDLGEFYTPNWLAQLAIERSGYDGGADVRVLDPACGSGTFLVAAINRVRAQPANRDLDGRTIAESILSNIIGFDLNPLAVIAARTNYLLALGPLVRDVPLVEIPVYLCDSILAPSVTDLGLLGEEYELRTSAGNFRIPSDLIDVGQLPTLTGLLDRCLDDDYPTRAFLEVARRELPLLSPLDEASLETLYASLVRLKEADKDGVWARLIRNAFAPITCGLFDYILGNPPWVNWQSLAPDYRAATLPLWTNLGLFSLKGHAARLGGGKKDLSALMLYRSMEAYLRGGGRLAFIITQSLFKSKGAGDGFRRFQLGAGARLKVLSVDDLTAMQPFEGATTQTAIALIEKGASTSYPIKYIKWRRRSRLAGLGTASLGEVKAAFAQDEISAFPINRLKLSSPWMTASSAISNSLREVMTASHYKAFAGVCTWSNGIYWLELESVTPNGLLRVRNRAEEAKEGLIEVHEALIEKTYVFPFVRSRDISRWRARPSSYMLVPQDPIRRTGISESVLRVEAARTFRYLRSFETQLSERSGMLKYFNPAKGDPFYSVYNVSGGTFAPYKVFWRQMVPRVTAAVIGPVDDPFLGLKPIVTQHVVSVIAAEDADEAHYLCALLNSAPTTCISASYSTGKSYGTPSMLEYVPIPKFRSSEKVHFSLTSLSRQAHEAASAGLQTADIEAHIDDLAAEVFGIEKTALPALRAFAMNLDHSPSRLEFREEAHDVN